MASPLYTAEPSFLRKHFLPKMPIDVQIPPIPYGSLGTAHFKPSALQFPGYYSHVNMPLLFNMPLL